MKPATKKGYVTLEAAIILPVFILAVVSLMYYINILSIQENVFNTTLDEASRLASKASVVKTAPGFKSVVIKRVQSENAAINYAKIDKFKYLYFDGDLNNMIVIDSDYRIDLSLPAGFAHGYPINVRIKCRGFTGVRKNGDTMTFEEMESEGNWDPVWIFPMSGEKFHDAGCSYVKVNAREMVLTGMLKNKYDACTLCDAATVTTGSYVYCFEENGTVYHRETCKKIKRYTIEVNREEAVGKGYTPCSKCGGG
jgi:hypothetical protein